MEIPSSVAKEHEDLHTLLSVAAREKGPLGGVARQVDGLLHPHLVKEEEFALPILSVLTLLPEEGFRGDLKEVMSMVMRLRKELPRMLEEHIQIAEALDVLAQEADRAGRREYVELAARLSLHIQMEEEVLYPAALLIGSYIEMKAVRA